MLPPVSISKPLKTLPLHSADAVTLRRLLGSGGWFYSLLLIFDDVVEFYLQNGRIQQEPSKPSSQYSASEIMCHSKISAQYSAQVCKIQLCCRQCFSLPTSERVEISLEKIVFDINWKLSRPSVKGSVSPMPQQ